MTTAMEALVLMNNSVVLKLLSGLFAPAGYRWLLGKTDIDDLLLQHIAHR